MTVVQSISTHSSLHDPRLLLESDTHPDVAKTHRNITFLERRTRRAAEVYGPRCAGLYEMKDEKV